LKFSGIKDAIDICQNFNLHAWGFDTSCLFDLLVECIKQADWPSGIWVWEQTELFAKMYKQDVGRVVGAMLALCLTCEKKASFEQIFGEALDNKKYVYWDPFARERKPFTPTILTDLADKAMKLADKRKNGEVTFNEDYDASKEDTRVAKDYPAVRQLNTGVADGPHVSSYESPNFGYSLMGMQDESMLDSEQDSSEPKIESEDEVVEPGWLKTIS